MDAPLVGDERDCEQNEHDDEHHALFTRREFENPECALHFPLGGLKSCHSERSEESQITSFQRLTEPVTRCLALLNMTTCAFHFLA
jgi:hypothetical protein